MDIKPLVTDLNDMILKGQILEAFDKYYADDVVMQENSDEPRVGKAVNRAFEENFVAGVAEMHGGKVVNIAVNDNVAMVEWALDVTFKDYGRTAMSQVAVQTWKDGKIENEHFFYAKG